MATLPVVAPAAQRTEDKLKRLCDTGGDDLQSMEVTTVPRIETTLTVGDDGVSAHIALPTPITPGRHPAVVIIDDGAGGGDPSVWVERIYGSVTDETFERPEALPFEKRVGFE